MWSPFPTKQSTKSPQELRGKCWNIFRTKNRVKHLKKIGDCSFRTFSGLTISSISSIRIVFVPPDVESLHGPDWSCHRGHILASTCNYSIEKSSQTATCGRMRIIWCPSAISSLDVLLPLDSHVQPTGLVQTIVTDLVTNLRLPEYSPHRNDYNLNSWQLKNAIVSVIEQNEFLLEF